MYPLIFTIVVFTAVTVIYPPAALMLFVLLGIGLAWAAWTKARANAKRRR